ncbi:uncharacterized protein MONBRDRAFT_7718 [Monosiga brevicollis MX1]|uniref:UV radiation resistance-associated gene protein n=1 Tax=Monosiga brevicollis TaxID=81824 RepID=A9UY38_MONBE|nr:uncharacterized protein MONBRDRAFT_7718 [Monosiga brevicollis MX1]EDQ89953.1 predicted protein [Monosiga brevicollis MX1]|eukprot:XP_001745375.1 hypothetical protein [Monosiga brevicollis MX1]
MAQLSEGNVTLTLRSMQRRLRHVTSVAFRNLTLPLDLDLNNTWFYYTLSSSSGREVYRSELVPACRNPEWRDRDMASAQVQGMMATATKLALADEVAIIQLFTQARNTDPSATSTATGTASSRSTRGLQRRPSIMARVQGPRAQKQQRTPDRLLARFRIALRMLNFASVQTEPAIPGAGSNIVLCRLAGAWYGNLNQTAPEDVAAVRVFHDRSRQQLGSLERKRQLLNLIAVGRARQASLKQRVQEAHARNQKTAVDLDAAEKQASSLLRLMKCHASADERLADLRTDTDTATSSWAIVNDSARSLRQQIKEVSRQIEQRQLSMILQVHAIYIIRQVCNLMGRAPTLFICVQMTKDSPHGYVCHVLTLLSKYMNIPMRHPITYLGSRSSICDLSKELVQGQPRRYQLYYNKRDKDSYITALRLLNGNVMQFLSLFRVRQRTDRPALLMDLRKLMRAIHDRLKIQPLPHRLCKQRQAPKPPKPRGIKRRAEREEEEKSKTKTRMGAWHVRGAAAAARVVTGA